MTSAIPVRRLAPWTTCIVSLALGSVATFVTVVDGGAPELGLLAWVVAAPVLVMLLVARVGAVPMGMSGVVSETMQPVVPSFWVRG